MCGRKLTLLVCMALAWMTVRVGAVPVFSSPAAELPSLLEFNGGARDAGGWLWLATDKGLFRYDGQRAEVFRADQQHPALLGSNNILCVAVSPHRPYEVWFGTKKGAYILNRNSLTIESLRIAGTDDAAELDDKRVSELRAAPDGTFWISYRHELLQVSPTRRLLHRYPLAWRGRSRAVKSLAVDRGGGLWIGLWNGGVCRLQPASRHLEPLHWPRADVPEELQMKEGKLYVTTSTATTIQYNLQGEMDSVFPPVSAPVDLPLDTHELCRVADPLHQQLYIGTFNSVYRWDARTASLHVVRAETGRVHALAVGHDGALYYLSQREGVCRLQAGRHERLSSVTSFKQMRLEGDTLLWLSDELGCYRCLSLRSDAVRPPRPRTGCVALDDSVWSTTESVRTLRLESGQDRLNLWISIFDYVLPAPSQIAWRMGNGGWTPLQAESGWLTLSDIPKGKSAVQIRMKNPDGQWGAPVTLLTVRRAYGWLWWAMWSLPFLFLSVFLSRYLNRHFRPSRNSEVGCSAISVGTTEGKDGLEERGHLDGAPLSGPPVQPSGLSVGDREFLEKVHAEVSSHMHETDYSVDVFSANLCMSRMNLYRKLKSLTGKTPTEYVRNVRLERAVRLLQTTSMSVNEVSDAVGFAYPSYFTKCFKDKYGISPKSCLSSRSDGQTLSGEEAKD